MLIFFRYDGQRAQIHRLADGSIRVFSRNMSETTSKFPDLVTLIQDLCKPSVSTFILDAEVSVNWIVLGYLLILSNNLVTI